MKLIFKILFLFLPLSMMPSCSASYHIITKPDKALVFSGDKKLGETPITVKESEVDTKTGNGVLLRIEKEGYKGVSVWIPSGMYDYSVSLNLSMFYQLSSNQNSAIESLSTRSDLYKVSDKLLSLQTQILLNTPIKTEDLEGLIKSNPTLGSAYFLSAITFINKGDKNQALLMLKEAIKYAPNEFDFLSLYNEISKEVGKK